jgi:hypothetical protein
MGIRGAQKDILKFNGNELVHRTKHRDIELENSKVQMSHLMKFFNCNNVEYAFENGLTK